MLGVDDRLVTADTMKWVKVGLGAGLATIPATIVLYIVLGMAVDAAFLAWLGNPALNTTGYVWSGAEFSVHAGNLVRDFMPWMIALVLLKAALSWLFRTGQFRASSEAKLNVRDQIYKQVVNLGLGVFRAILVELDVILRKERCAPVAGSHLHLGLHEELLVLFGVSLLALLAPVD